MDIIRVATAGSMDHIQGWLLCLKAYIYKLRSFFFISYF